MSERHYTGIDIGGTKVAVILGRAAGDREPAIEVVKRVSFPTPRGPEASIRAIVESARELAGGLSPVAFGVSCGGPLDTSTGTVLSPPNLPGWDAVPIVATLERSLGMPGALQNDANACALAEWRQGAGRGCRSMVFLTFGTGMGAGLILDGRLYEGREGMAGEVGHIRLAEDGPEGYGKRGSFEGFCSGGGIARLGQERAKSALAGGSPVTLAATPREIERLTAHAICDAARSGDPFARGVTDTTACYLGRGLAVIIDILNPEAIVLGGVYARAHDLFLPGAQAVIQVEALEISRRACRILPASLGESIGDIAALSVAASRLAHGAQPSVG